MQSCIGPIMDEANPTDEAPGKPSGV
jgi:hypothetical protein